MFCLPAPLLRVVVVLRGHGLHLEGMRAGEEGVREREDGRAAGGEIRGQEEEGEAKGGAVGVCGEAGKPEQGPPQVSERPPVTP